MTRLFLSICGLLLSSAFLACAQAPLRAGDSVEIRLSGVPAEDSAEFSQVYNIDNRGLVNLPYVGEIRAAGLLPNQVQTDVQNRLIAGKIYKNPTITVSPTAAAPRFVNVGGAVKGEGRIPYTPDLTLLSAINAAGGFTEFADEKKVRLIREGRGATYNVKDIRKRPDTDPKLLPGDTIEVSTTWFGG